MLPFNGCRSFLPGPWSQANILRRSCVAFSSICAPTYRDEAGGGEDPAADPVMPSWYRCGVLCSGLVMFLDEEVAERDFWAADRGSRALQGHLADISIMAVNRTNPTASAEELRLINRLLGEVGRSTCVGSRKCLVGVTGIFRRMS